MSFASYCVDLEVFIKPFLQFCNGCGNVTCHHWDPDVAPHEWRQCDWRVRPRRRATLLELALLHRSMLLFLRSAMPGRRCGPPICCAAVNCRPGMRTPAVTPFPPPCKIGGDRTSDACKVFRWSPGPLPRLIVHARPSGLRFRSTPLIVTRRAGRHGISLVPREKPRDPRVNLADACQHAKFRASAPHAHLLRGGRLNYYP